MNTDVGSHEQGSGENREVERVRVALRESLRAAVGDGYTLCVGDMGSDIRRTCCGLGSVLRGKLGDPYGLARATLALRISERQGDAITIGWDDVDVGDAAPYPYEEWRQLGADLRREFLEGAS